MPPSPSTEAASRVLSRPVGVVLTVTGLMVACLPLTVLVGLAIHRHAEPLVLTLASVVLVLAPPLMVGLVSRTRGVALGSALWAWSITLFLVLPVYFPGERRQAIVTALAFSGVGGDTPDRIADSLPEEPEMAVPEVAEAARLVVEPPPPAEVPLTADQIALPYEGEGRRLSVPVIFANDGREVEVDMMLDTGATYTTLSHDMLARLGASPTERSPVIRLHTANGERDAQVVLLDEVWLGDLLIEGVAVSTCDDCASDHTAGLLGLNVANGFNLSIDGDRQEVVFSRRARFDRRLDVRPFSHLEARFTRFPGGRVEVEVALDNLSRRLVRRAVTSVTCGPDTWTVPLLDLPPGELAEIRQRLPRHEPCTQYEIALHEADW